VPGADLVLIVSRAWNVAPAWIKSSNVWRSHLN